MNKTITVNQENIDYILKTSLRARRTRLAVFCDGRVVVTAPRNLEQKHIDEFITKHTEWITKKINHYKTLGYKLFLKNSKSDFKKHKQEAQKYVEEKVQLFNQFYKFKYNSITIKNQKTRWGSCSKRGNLNFNYNTYLLPENLADYIVVHEICHLSEFNHGKKFWDLVSQCIPDYKELRSELKKVGMV